MWCMIFALLRIAWCCTCSEKWHEVRTATDPADPDLLTTRIQNLRSGSVNKICLLNLVQKFGYLKNFLSWNIIRKSVLFRNFQKKHTKILHFEDIFDWWKTFRELTDPDLSLPGPGPVFRIRGNFTWGVILRYCIAWCCKCSEKWHEVPARAVAVGVAWLSQCIAERRRLERATLAPSAHRGLHDAPERADDVSASTAPTDDVSSTATAISIPRSSILT